MNEVVDVFVYWLCVPVLCGMQTLPFYHYLYYKFCAILWQLLRIVFNSFGLLTNLFKMILKVSRGIARLERNRFPN